MKKIGILGGLSWESTAYYYKIMNEMMHAILGKHHSIEAIIYSLNFQSILNSVNADRWDEVEIEAGNAIQILEKAGSDFLIITSNAMHKIYAELADRVKIPILHIVDPTAQKIKEKGIKKIGLLGTKLTMQESFYKDRLLNLFDIETTVPDSNDQNILDQIIFDELTIGIINPLSKEKIKEMIIKFQNQGVEGVVLGCTELTLIISQQDTELDLFDTPFLHAQECVKLAIQ